MFRMSMETAAQILAYEIVDTVLYLEYLSLYLHRYSEFIDVLLFYVKNQLSPRSVLFFNSYHPCVFLFLTQELIFY